MPDEPDAGAGARPARAPRQYSRTLPLVLVILGWLFLFPDNPVTLLSASELAAQRLDAQHGALSVLNSTRWGDFSPVVAPGDGEDGAEPGANDTAPRFLNLTGFREGDGLAWGDVGTFRDRCLAASRAAIPPVGGEDRWSIGEGQPVWQNVSGHIHGTWVRRDASALRQAADYNLSAIAPDVEWTGARAPWARNVTGREGKLKARLHDREGGDAAGANMVRAELMVEDADGSGATWNMRLHGVHFRRHGALLLTTTSEKFDGIFALPHLGPGPDFFAASQAVLNETITRRLRERARYLSFDASIPWTSDVHDVDVYSPSPHCEYVMYAQVHPPDQDRLDMRSFRPGADAMDAVIADIERELKHPFGSPIRGVPDLQLSAVIYSPDCAFFLETKGPPDFAPLEGRHLVGMKAEVFRSRLNACLLAYALVFAAQIHLLKRQMRETSTPSTMGRVSFHTGAVMLVADALVAGGTAALMLSSESPLQALALLFCAFTSLLVGATFLYQVFEVQQQDWIRQREREATRGGGGSAAPSADASRGGSAPASGPPSRPSSPPVIVPSDQDVDAEIQEVANAASAVPRGPQQETPPTFSSAMSRVALSTSALFFLLIASTTWYPPARHLLVNLVAFLYLSLWVPQIHRNVQRNCRRAFSRAFVTGQSLLRLAPLAYVYCVRDNVLFAQTDRATFAALAGWVWAQLWVLAAQDVLGPRFGIPRSWAAPAWDYHPVLRLDALESGRLPLALTPDALPEVNDPGVKAVDCAICREVLELPILPARAADDKGAGVAAVLASRAYMVTPCRHVFHSACLEGWMVFRLQCPICREDLPSL